MIEKLKTLVGDSRVFLGENLKEHTTFRVGGPAKIFVTVNTVEELIKVQNLLKEESVPFFVIGNGSNLLVSDNGYGGAVISLSGDFNELKVSGEEITAGAGVILSKVCTLAKDNELSGLEFAFGIPGTVGGAMVMNAGAYDGEMAFVVKDVTLLDSNGNIKVLSNSEMQFSYRNSILKKESLIVLKTTFLLKKGVRAEIQAKMDDFIGRRRDKQPLEYPSAGSTFKRPEGHFAGKLIMEAGLSGKRVGGASVSSKHCGFVVNDNNATADDISKLMDTVIKTVEESFGVTLEPEVIKIGTFN